MSLLDIFAAAIVATFGVSFALLLILGFIGFLASHPAEREDVRR